MKYIKILSIAALAMAMAACSGKAEKDGKALAEAEEGVTVVTDDQQTEAVNEVKTNAVNDVTDDQAFRPNMKVDKLTILDFNATWCGPCRKIAPNIEKSAAEFGDKIAVYSVDIDQNPTTANAFGVEAVPTIVIIRPDGKTTRIVGIESIDTYEKWAAVINENL